MQVTQTSWLYRAELTALQNKENKPLSELLSDCTRARNQPTWLLKEMRGKDSKPQVFNLILNSVVKGGAAEAVYSVGFSPGDLPPAKPTWLPSLTRLPHHCE